MTLPVSICLTTYNRGAVLPKTLDSLLAQSFTDFELIISDDNSTDNTEAVCRQYASRDQRIRYIRNETNLGMPGNLNAALQIAKGHYLANLHDGDVYRQDLIEKWLEALEQYPKAGFVFNAYRSVLNGQNIIYREQFPNLIPGHALGLRLLSHWGSCVFGTVMAPRDVYERVGWFDPQFGNFSDVDMWLRIAYKYDVAYIAEPLMDLMPKDPTRFYGFVHWQVVFWLLGIHVVNLQRYRPDLPDPVQDLMLRYPKRSRNYWLYNMLICIKHRRVDRVREGLAIWRDANDRWLKSAGRVFGKPKDAPEWYTANHFWNLVNLAQ